MTVIALKDVTKSFGPVHVIKGVNLQIRDGEFMVFVGPSGCGKSTLLRLIAGLEDISTGTLSFDNVVVNGYVPSKRGIAMVFQSYALYPHMTVYENMAFGLKLNGRTPDDIKKSVEKAAELLQIRQYLDRLPKQLSGGQRQRVAIGRAIVRDPKVFLFDEPLSNLDAALRVATRLEIAKLHHSMNKVTMIYVTHDQVEAMTLADRIVIMRDGYIEQVGTPSEVFDRPANVFVAGFIGSPPMNQLDAEISSAAGRPVARLTDGMDIPVPAEFAAKVAGGQQIVLGFRPESLAPKGHALHSASESVALTRPVVIAEPLGTETIVFTELAGREVQGRMLNPRPVRAGEVMEFVLDLTRLHFFDKTSGRSLRL